jgi:hypothetical protein
MAEHERPCGVRRGLKVHASGAVRSVDLERAGRHGRAC